MTDRIRVAVVVTRFIAGAGGVAYRGARALDPNRYEPVIFASPVGSLLARAEEEGFRVVRLRWMRSELSPQADVRGLRELTAALRGFDVVHTHSAKAGVLGRLAGRRAGVPAVVHTFHGFPFHDFQWKPRRAAYIRIERRLGRITDEFLAVGGSVAAEAIKLRIASPEKITAIAPAIETTIVPRSAKSRAAARALLGVTPDVRVIGTVGRLDEQKAPLDFVAAMRALGRDDVLAVWVGDGPLRARTEREIARAGLTGRFLLLGERDDVPALLPGFDIFAMSSLYEGLPCALVEAMTCGVPSVVTAVNAVPEIAVPGKTALLVRPRDPDGLSRALGWLLDHPQVARRMAIAARAGLGTRFASAQLGEDVSEIYERALSARSIVRGQGDVSVLARDDVGFLARQGLG